MIDFLALTRDLCSIPSGVVNDGNERVFARIASELPMEIFRFHSGEKFNGWEIPQKWTVQKATIALDDEVIYDGLTSPLGVASYSRSYQGQLSLEQLRPHLFSRADLPEAIPWHCSWFYQPWKEEWGFCLPHKLLGRLKPGKYDVVLETTFQPGEMLVGVHEKKGVSGKTIVFHSNNCHPHMASDGFAGTALLIRLFQWLSSQKTHYSYKLIVAPEHYGSIFYLRDHNKEEIERYVGGIFAEMLGNKGPFVVAATFNGDHYLDQVLRYAAGRYARNPKFVAFRESAGNDETVWEAPGYEVPFLQINRSNDRNMHYPEYHTNFDNPELMEHELLLECYDVFQRAIRICETDSYLHRKFNGLIALSNPAYDLYVSRVDPAVLSDDRQKSSASWGHLQDCIPRYFDGKFSILDIAEKHKLDYFELLSYLEAFKAKGLVRFESKEIERTSVNLVDQSNLMP